MATFTVKKDFDIPPYIVEAVRAMIDKQMFYSSEDLLVGYLADQGAFPNMAEICSLVKEIAPDERIVPVMDVARDYSKLPEPYYDNAQWSDDFEFDAYCKLSPYNEGDYDLQDQWKASVRNGKKIDAIKTYRKLHGGKAGIPPVGLKEAKDAIDQYERTIRGDAIGGERWLLVWDVM